MSFKVGDVIVCIESCSHAYTKGVEYPVVEVDDVLGSVGNDGLFDPFSLLLSKFKKKLGKKKNAENGKGRKNEQPK